jgi:Uma2 family endonuclease
MSTEVQKEKINRRISLPATVTTPSPMPLENFKVRRHSFSVEDYHAMVEAGVLKEDERVELIEGEIIEMSPIGKLHASCVKRLMALFFRRIGEQATISVQDPVQASSFSEPQPDVALLKYREDFYAARHPRPKDILLVIEVADSTIDYDREVKMPLYARARIPQAVLVDLSSDVVEVYAKPVRGKYTQAQTLKRGQSLKIQKLPNMKLTVDEILG